MVQSFSHIQTPSVFPAAAGRIDLLGDDAMGVVIIYSLFELGRSGIISLINSRDPNNISSDTVAASAIPFLTACEYALSVLPKLKTGVAVRDQHDAALLEQIKQAVGGSETRLLTSKKYACSVETLSRHQELYHYTSPGAFEGLRASSQNAKFGSRARAIT